MNIIINAETNPWLRTRLQSASKSSTSSTDSSMVEGLLESREKHKDKYKDLFEGSGIEFVYDDEVNENNDEETSNKEETEEQNEDDKKKTKRRHFRYPPRYNKKPVNPFKTLSDASGLQKAYDDNENNVYVDGDTLYISGTKNADSLVSTAFDPSIHNIHKNYKDGKYQDVWDDLKIPFHKTGKSQRYKDVQKVLDENPDITHMVGHSLGGSVAYEAQKNYPDRNLNVSTYGAPVISLPGDPSGKNRYRHPGDLISILDRGANTQSNTSSSSWFNPHTYEGFSNNNVFRSNAVFDPGYSASS